MRPPVKVSYLTVVVHGTTSVYCGFSPPSLGVNLADSSVFGGGKVTGGNIERRAADGGACSWVRRKAWP